MNYCCERCKQGFKHEKHYNNHLKRTNPCKLKIEKKNIIIGMKPPTFKTKDIDIGEYINKEKKKSGQRRWFWLRKNSRKRGKLTKI